MIARAVLPLAAVVLMAPAFAQSPRGSIEGRTFDRKTGAALKNVTVGLNGPYKESVLGPHISSSTPPRVRVTADDSGRFVFANLAAGNYALQASRDGYARANYGDSRVAWELVAVADGQQVKDVVLTLNPLGTIVGKVVDEKDRPVQNARIAVYRYSLGAWFRSVQTGEARLPFFSTNDLGEYRVFGLAPGPYVVSALYPYPPNLSYVPVDQGIGYPTTYFPNAHGPDTAGPVVVASGEVVRADIKLEMAPAYRISGVVTDANGPITGRACVAIAPSGSQPAEFLLVGNSWSGGQGGGFTIFPVRPGSYVLIGAICDTQPRVAGIAAVEVGGNVDGVTLRTEPAVQVRGTVIVEGDANLAGGIALLHPFEQIAPVEPHAQLRADGGFALDALRFSHYIPEIGPLPTGWYLKAARYGGQDVPATGFEFRPGALLEFTVSNQGAAQAGGAVVDAAGRPVRYPLVTAIPAGGGSPIGAAQVMGDVSGRFQFPALRPGEYIAAAWDGQLDAIQLQRNPRLLKLLDKKGLSVKATPGPQADVALTLITAGEIDQARAKP